MGLVAAVWPGVAVLLRECMDVDPAKRPCAAEAQDRLRAALFGAAWRTCSCAVPCPAHTFLAAHFPR